MQETTAEMRKKAAIDALLAAYDRPDQPGVVAAVSINGIVVYAKGFGLASVELPVRLSPAIRMRIGSTTKHFTALAYLLLCEEGRASLDDEIGMHIAELHPENRRATVRDLLGHVSGLRDAWDYSMQLQGTNLKVTDEEMLRFYVAGEGINAAPRREWSYSNGGYMLVAIAIARLSGGSFGDFLRERIFEPLGMHDTVLRRWDTEHLPNSAALHFRASEGLWTQHYMGMDLGGAGGIASTAEDMLRWMRHMDRPVVGSAESWRQLMTPLQLENGVPTGYGLGLEIGTYRGMKTISHSGSVISGTSQMIKLPEAKLDIMIMANRSDVSTTSLANQMIDICIEGLPVSDAGSAALPVSGHFVSDETGRVLEINGDEGQLAINAFTMPARLYADDVIRLAQPLNSDHLEIRVAETGDAIEYRSLGYVDQLRRILPKPGGRALLSTRTYRSQGGSFDATIERCETGHRLVTSGPQVRQTFALEPVTDHIWRFMSGTSAFRSGILRFDEDFSAFQLTAARTRNWRFAEVPD